MEFYKFKTSTNHRVIGVFPQCDPAPTVNPNDSDSYRFVVYDKFPNFIPRVELKMNPNSKWTDILSIVGPSHGNIVNYKVKVLLEKHSLTANAFYPITVHENGLKKEYYWFHAINNDFWDWVDKEQSSLLLRSILPDERHKVLGKADLYLGKEGLVELARSKPRLTDYYWDKLVLANNFPDLDFFTTLFPSRHTVISENLLKSLRAAKTTGYETEPFDEVVLFD